MKKLEIGVGGVREAAAEFLDTAKAIRKRQPVRVRERLLFADMPTLLKNLTAERWRLVEAVRQKGPLSINAAARLLRRNYKNVHGDVKRLVELGLIDKQEDGRMRMPYRTIVAQLEMAA